MNEIKFFFDGRLQTIDFTSIKPTTTVLEFLRSYPGRFGTKEGCNEGDCGACTVVIAQPNGNKFDYQAVNSCMVFLPYLHGKFLITVEDLSSPTQLHPIQQAFIDNYASQCGFCTPGFEMSLFALYKSNPNPTEEEISEAVEGNLCRCTGYRPIRDAALSLRTMPLKDHITDTEPQVLEALKTIDNPDVIDLSYKDEKYFIPFSLKKAMDLLKQYPEAKIINGATDAALLKNKKKQDLPLIVDLSFISEISYIEEKNREIIIGAGVRVQQLKDFSRDKLPFLYDYLKVFAAKQIRNRASVGGNIMTASPIGDLIPPFITMDASVVIASSNGDITMPLEDFITGYRSTALKPGQILKQIIIPVDNKRFYRFYKVSKRTSLDISTVSLAASIEAEGNTVKDIRLTYGGMAEMVKRARKTEDFLRGQEITEENFLAAANIVKQEFTPISDARSFAQARSIMAKNLLIKFYQDLTQNSKQ